MRDDLHSICPSPSACLEWGARDGLAVAGVEPLGGTFPDELAVQARHAVVPFRMPLAARDDLDAIPEARRDPFCEP